jgi:hypothetical protein
VLDKSLMKTYMLVLYRGMHWFQQWVQLQRHEENATGIKEASRALETTVIHIFSPTMAGGLVIELWLHNNG